MRALWVNLLLLAVGAGAGEPPPPPVFENLSLVSRCRKADTPGVYLYEFSVINPPTNTIPLDVVAIAVGPQLYDVEFSYKDAFFFPFGITRNFPGPDRLEEDALFWGAEDVAPGSQSPFDRFRAQRPPAIRRYRVAPRLHLYFQEWLEATGEPELDLEVTQEWEKRYNRLLWGLGPLPVWPGSFEHWDVFISDVGRAGELGWVRDSNLVGLLQGKLRQGRQAVLDGDMLAVHRLLGEVRQAVEQAPASVVGEEARSLVLLNVEFLDENIPAPCEPKVALTPPIQEHRLGEEAQVQARAWNNATGSPLVGQQLTLSVVEGPHASLAMSGVTDGNGEVVFRYRGEREGRDWVMVGSEATVAGGGRQQEVAAFREAIEKLVREKQKAGLGAQEAGKLASQLLERLDAIVTKSSSWEEKRWQLANFRRKEKLPVDWRRLRPEKGPMSQDTCGFYGGSERVAVDWRGGPDLGVSSFTPQVLESAPGRSFFVYETTGNAGTVASPPTTTRYYLGSRYPVDRTQALVVGERRVPALGVGEESRVERVVLAVPAQASPGRYFLDACADAQGEVVETNEANNCASSQVHFTFYVRGPNHPPDCSGAQAVPPLLWPPNHRLVGVGIAGVVDPDGDPVELRIVGITQDEPTNGLGDGDQAPDGFGVGTGEAQVRAERSGTGNGRVYRVSFTGSDGKGGTCQSFVMVGVPHDRAHAPVDDGQNYDSTR